jgi:hypothetical protein
MADELFAVAGRPADSRDPTLLSAITSLLSQCARCAAFFDIADFPQSCVAASRLCRSEAAAWRSRLLRSRSNSVQVIAITLSIGAHHTTNRGWHCGNATNRLCSHSTTQGVAREETDRVPFYCPVNEVSFWAGPAALSDRNALRHPQAVAIIGEAGAESGNAAGWTTSWVSWQRRTYWSRVTQTDSGSIARSWTLALSVGNWRTDRRRQALFLQTGLSLRSDPRVTLEPS